MTTQTILGNKAATIAEYRKKSGVWALTFLVAFKNSRRGLPQIQQAPQRSDRWCLNVHSPDSEDTNF
jgi:hypothetical protein